MISEYRVNSFHEGQVWESPRGSLYKVMDVARGGQAVLRLGRDGAGRIVRRDWDAVVSWILRDEVIDGITRQLRKGE